MEVSSSQKGMFGNHKTWFCLHFQHYQTFCFNFVKRVKLKRVSLATWPRLCILTGLAVKPARNGELKQSTYSHFPALTTIKSDCQTSQPFLYKSILLSFSPPAFVLLVRKESEEGIFVMKSYISSSARSNSCFFFFLFSRLRRASEE